MCDLKTKQIQPQSVLILRVFFLVSVVDFLVVFENGLVILLS